MMKNPKTRAKRSKLYSYFFYQINLYYTYCACSDGKIPGPQDTGWRVVLGITFIPIIYCTIALDSQVKVTGDA